MSGVDESLVTPAVVGVLEDELSCPVGYGAPPTPAAPATRLDPAVGWVTVHVIPLGLVSEAGWGGQSAAMETIEYQVTASGASLEHSSALAVEAAEHLTGRAGGGWANDLAVAGHSVMNRRRVGRMNDLAGEDVFHSGQRVWLLVHRSG